MPLRAVQSYTFGGVDTRSNPLNMPTTRFLRCRNLVPMADGHFELRRGYSPVRMSAVVNAAIHSLTKYKVLGGTRNGVFFQGTTAKLIDVATGAVSQPTVKGNPFSSASRFSYAIANGRLLAFNGTDKKFFDGTTWRDIGIPALTAADVAGVTVAVGIADPNAIPATSIGGAQPGYVLWIALWNRTTNAVSNAIQIGSRVAPSVASRIDIANLPVPSDPEWDILVGRTKDGALVPYVIIDSSATFVYVPNGTTNVTIANKDIDGNYELPTRNGVPVAFKRICQAGNRAYGNPANSPFVYRSESPDDSTQGSFLGSWEQCWALNNLETFPTGDEVTCLQEYTLEPWVFTLTHMAILDESNAEPGWQGPWEIGCAGQEAFVKTPYGPFWITGEKQLGTMASDGPVPISDEYERGLLSQIADQYLSDTECRYVRIPSKNIDHIMIKARRADGTPFRIIHDFKLRDELSPYGQGYEDVFSGVLGDDYTTAEMFSEYGQRKLWAGGSDGRFYELYTESEDDGSQFIGEAISLLNAGPNRPRVPNIEWYGDQNVRWAVAQSLDKRPAEFRDITKTLEVVPGGEHDYQYRVTLFDAGDTSVTSELKHVYLRMQLSSHGKDGNLKLNDPPHMPLETYGRIYMISPLFGGERGHTK